MVHVYHDPKAPWARVVHMLVMELNTPGPIAVEISWYSPARGLVRRWYRGVNAYDDMPWTMTDLPPEQETVLGQLSELVGRIEEIGRQAERVGVAARGSIGRFGGVEIIESDHVPEGQAIIMNGRAFTPAKCGLARMSVHHDHHHHAQGVAADVGPVRGARPSMSVLDEIPDRSRPPGLRHQKASFEMKMNIDFRADDSLDSLRYALLATAPTLTGGYACRPITGA